MKGLPPRASQAAQGTDSLAATQAEPSALRELLARVEAAEGKPCAHCGAVIPRPPKPSAAQWGRRLYCNRSCRAKAVNAAHHQKPIEDRLRALSVQDEASGCRNWIGPTDKHGYGKITVNNKPERAHRVAYATFVEPTRGLHVLHRCDNRRCINPAHLFLGTNADNTADRNAKGRQARGEGHARARLTAADVRAIRGSGRRIADLAAEYGVGETAISNIIHRRSWKHVAD